MFSKQLSRCRGTSPTLCVYVPSWSDRYADIALFSHAGFFAAMGQAGGGRSELDPRFVSTFCVFNLTSSSDETVKHIYRSILIGHTEGFVEEIRAVVPIVVEITLGLYKVRRSILSELLLFP